MPKIIKIMLNEMQQQCRRKAIWVAFAALFLYLLDKFIPPADLMKYAHIPDDSAYVYQGVSKYIGSFFFLIMSVLCSDRILKDISNECFDILIATPMKKMEYYFGKLIGNIILFSAIGFVYMVVFSVYDEMVFHVSFSDLMIGRFFLLYIACMVFYIILGAVFAISISIISRSCILTVVLAAFYYNLDIILPSFTFSTISLMIDLLFSSYSTFTQVVLDPAEFEQTQPLSKEFEMAYPFHFTLQKAMLSLASFIVLMILLCTISFLIFRKREYKPGGMHIR